MRPTPPAFRMTPPVLCLGAAHWDVIAHAGGPMPPGADRPGRVVRRPGGVALNVALALADRGAATVLIAAVGRDHEGYALLAAATALGVNCGRALRLDRRTDAYVAIEAAGELVAAVADCRTLEAAGVELLAAVRDLGPWPGPAILDGNLPAAVLDAVAVAGPRGTARYLAAASPDKAARLAGFIRQAAPTVAANRAEAEALCALSFASAEPAARALVALGARRAVVTDGPRPAALAGHDGALAVRAPAARAPASVTGAGDVLLAALVAADLAGVTDPAALLAGALAAAATHIACEAS